MKTENTISLTLSTQTGEKTIYSIKNPRLGVQKEDVLNAAKDILDSKVFAVVTKGWPHWRRICSPYWCTLHPARCH